MSHKFEPIGYLNEMDEFVRFTRDRPYERLREYIEISGLTVLYALCQGATS